MRLPVFQFIPDLHDTDGTFRFGYVVFPFLWRVIREHLSQLAGGHEENIVGQDLLDVIVMDSHILLSLAQHFVYIADSFFQSVQGACLFWNDFFPVPLVHIDRVDVVCDFVPADGTHVGVKSLSDGKTVFL